jgi:Dip2/Utp12 Family/WD domain, G-beta repeat
VIKWNVKKCKQEATFDVGPEKPTAVCSINNGQYIATASKTIKIWNENQELIQTFTGHTSNVLILKSFTFNDENFIVSASKNDRTLSMWRIVEDDKKSSCYATFSLLSNSANYVDLNVIDGNLSIACICRNESLSFFNTNLSSIKSKKPVKVKFTLEIAADETKDVTHVPLKCATIAGSDILIGYGDTIMKFEKISAQQELKNTILVRKDPMRMEIVKKDKKSMKETLNIVTPITDQNAEILNSISAKKRLLKPTELPLETRLENLTVDTGKRPNAKKLTHQLIQGLHGNDANILRNVLRQTDEETVRLTVKYLPSQYVMSFVNELSLLMSKKTAGSEIALTWLRHLIQVHSSSLLAFGAINLSETFGTTLGIIDHRTQNLPALMRMRGRLFLDSIRFL